MNTNGGSTERRLRVGINTEITRKVDFDNDGPARMSLTHNYTVKDLTLAELAAEIGQHHNICNPCFNGQKFHRKKEFCQSADIIWLDFDNDKEIELPDVRDQNGKPKKVKVRCDDADYLSYEDALRDPFIKQYATIAYPSPSYTEDWNRFRVGFAFPSRLAVSQFLSQFNDVEKESERQQKAQRAFEQHFDALARYLIWRFKTDDACKDCSRFFYGTHQSDRVIVLGGSLTKEAITALRHEYEAAHPKPTKKEIGAAVSVDDYSPDAAIRRTKYGEWALATAKAKIEAAPMGERHKTRARMAYMVGGYIGGGLLDEQAALDALESSVQCSTEHFNKAWKTILDCIAVGITEPITFEHCEGRRKLLAAKNVKDEDEPLVLADGEIIDVADDPPISDDPDLETYLRKVLANASRFTRARMMMAVALGFTKLPWRLLDAILAYERNRLGVKVITNDKMLDLYAANGDRAASESTLKRDKKKLWNAQGKIGVELVWYLKGYETEDGRRFGSRYKSNLDRWVLEALALAIKKKGKYSLADAEIKAACDEVAKQVPRCQIEDEKKKKDPDGITLEMSAEESLMRVVPKFSEAWDAQKLPINDREARTRNIARRFITALFSQADTSILEGKRQRKRSESETRQMADDLLTDVLKSQGSISPPSARTVDSKGAENAPQKADLQGSKSEDLHGGQNEPLWQVSCHDEESTTYSDGHEVLAAGMQARKIARRRGVILDRFAEINSTAGELFVERQFSDEVCRLAEEMSDLDRELARLATGEPERGNVAWEF